MFNNIIGNEYNKEILKSNIISGNISHSYIFSGISGIGKFLFAKEFAKAILCTAVDNIRPCNACKSCESFINGNNPDIIIIDEKEGTIKTETIKNMVNDVLEKPIQSSKKVYIINNSENMTREAQNSLLKTLEEPPEYVVIILITYNKNMLLNTIKSRCIEIKFNSLSNNELKQYFYNISEKLNEKFYRYANGSIETAIKLKDNENIYENIEELFGKIESTNELEILKIKDLVFQDKDEIYSILEYINGFFYNRIKEDITKAEKYYKCIKVVEDTKQRLKSNSNYDMTIDYLLMTIWEELNNG